MKNLYDVFASHRAHQAVYDFDTYFDRTSFPICTCRQLVSTRWSSCDKCPSNSVQLCLALLLLHYLMLTYYVYFYLFISIDAFLAFVTLESTYSYFCKSLPLHVLLTTAYQQFSQKQRERSQELLDYFGICVSTEIKCQDKDLQNNAALLLKAAQKL